ncbi:hypothetical protein WMY93_031816 [Mugilogobius chulae]|uniref:Uncharacterized protein n=1 Tax=Mugilogobius chulae TaxID=88201 RepID=A0AAW0MFH8_9GOBI
MDRTREDTQDELEDMMRPQEHLEGAEDQVPKTVRVLEHGQDQRGHPGRVREEHRVTSGRSNRDEDQDVEPAQAPGVRVHGQDQRRHPRGVRERHRVTSGASRGSRGPDRTRPRPDPDPDQTQTQTRPRPDPESEERPTRGRSLKTLSEETRGRGRGRGRKGADAEGEELIGQSLRL